MAYQPVAQQLCTVDMLGKAPKDHYIALNIGYVQAQGKTTYKISLGTIPHRVVDPEATANYRMFTPLLTPEGTDGKTRQEICTLECQALDEACKVINARYAEEGIPCSLSSDNFFLLVNGRVVFVPDHPLKV